MEFREWLQKECFYWYLLDEKQVDDYFSRWFDEVKNGGSVKNLLKNVYFSKFYTKKLV